MFLLSNFSEDTNLEIFVLLFLFALSTYKLLQNIQNKRAPTVMSLCDNVSVAAGVHKANTCSMNFAGFLSAPVLLFCFAPLGNIIK